VKSTDKEGEHMAIVCRKEISAKEKAQIRRALTDIKRCVHANRATLPIDLLEELTNFFNPRKRPKVEIFVSKKTIGKWGEAGGYSIWIHPNCFGKMKSSGTSRLAAELFHELVHIANGNELDAEVFENLIFAKKGATPPTKCDWPKFKGVDYRGWWVYLQLPKSTNQKEKANVINLWRRDPAELVSRAVIVRAHGSKPTLGRRPTART
jgi:hypothetical protein